VIAKERVGSRHPLRLALLLVLSLMTAVLAAEPASAKAGGCAESGNYETCFTYGRLDGNTDPDRTIIAEIKAKIEATTAAAKAGETGDYLRIALYEWADDSGGGGLPLANAVADAARAGVSVRIVVHAMGDAVQDVLAQVQPPIDLHFCADDACTPDNVDGAMHNKFFLIQKGSTRLVLQSSSNVGLTQSQHAQNMLIVRDDDALFTAYLNYWRRLYARSWTYGGVTWDTNADRTIDGSNDKSKAYFFPQPGSTRVADVLGNVTSCDAPDHDRVWLEASLLDESSDYSKGIIKELVRLKNLGCDVKVLIQQTKGNNALAAAGINAHCDGYNHNKLMLVDAYYASAWRRAVFVGSYNLTTNSAHESNDTMLRVINDWVTDRYTEQFKALWAGDNPCD
jgi:phosphatidylserine/phosphatidylglycerophosphate/cardiolipin synthase-like enzyme